MIGGYRKTILQAKMKVSIIIMALLLFSCSEEKSSLTYKEHEVIREEIAANYQKNQAVFQSLTSQVASFKILRTIKFKYGHFGKDGIYVYCDSIDRNLNGQSFAIHELSDRRFGKVLQQEGIPVSIIEDIKRQLDQINCNSFSTVRTINVTTGTPYMHTEIQYDDWNGANFYFYILFDKKLEPDMIQFFDRRETQMGALKGIGGVLDSNAVWYLPYD